MVDDVEIVEDMEIMQINEPPPPNRLEIMEVNKERKNIWKS